MLEGNWIIEESKQLHGERADKINFRSDAARADDRAA